MVLVEASSFELEATQSKLQEVQAGAVPIQFEYSTERLRTRNLAVADER